jgi:predicted HicB family RNase H-like nuclease
MALQPKTTRRDRQSKIEAIEAASKEDTKRLNAQIPVSLHSKVKIRAVEEGRNLVDVVIDALNEYLSK